MAPSARLTVSLAFSLAEHLGHAETDGYLKAFAFMDELALLNRLASPQGRLAGVGQARCPDG